MLGATMALQIGGCGTDEQLDRSQGLRHQTGVAEVADAHGQIEAFLDQAHLAIAQLQIDGDLGIFMQEATHQRRQVTYAKGEGRTDPEPPLGPLVAFLQALLEGLQITEQRDQSFMQRTPGLGQAQGAGGALQQPSAVVALQGRQVLGKRRARQLQPLRRGGQAAQFDDLDEGLQGSQSVQGLFP